MRASRTGTVRAAVRRPGPGAFDTRLLPPMVLGAVLNPINSSILAVSLVPIGVDFGAPASQTAWLVSALYLATSIGQPVAGRLVDTYGSRPLLLSGAALTGVAGLLGALAPNLPVLVSARVLLGFGTCAGYPAAMSLIRREADRTGQDSPGGVLTVLAISSQIVAAVGPTLGGVLIGVGGWRTTLAVNVPLAVACFALGARRLPRLARTGNADLIGSFDVAGIGLFAGVLVPALLFVMDPRLDRAWLVVLAAVCAGGFVVRELRCREPFIDLRVLAGNRPLMLTYLRALTISLVSYTFLYGFTQWLEDGGGLSASHSGLLLLPMFGLAIGVSALTGRRPEIKAKLLVGQSMQVLACCLLLLVSGDSAIWFLLAIVAVLGVPQGLNNLATQNAVYHQADPERTGASAGLLRTFLYLGAILSAAVDGAFYGTRASTTGLHHIAIFVVAVSVLGLAVTVGDRSLARVGRSAPGRGRDAPGRRGASSSSAGPGDVGGNAFAVGEPAPDPLETAPGEPRRLPGQESEGRDAERRVHPERPAGADRPDGAQQGQGEQDLRPPR